MSTNHDSIFLLEVIAYRVTLTDPKEMLNSSPLCICFRFPKLVDLEICEGRLCNKNENPFSRCNGEFLMSRGKSCLFSICSSNLCRTSRNFRSVVSVYRHGEDGLKTRIIAQSMLEFDKTFTDIIHNPNQSNKTRELKQVCDRIVNNIVHRIGR